MNAADFVFRSLAGFYQWPWHMVHTMPSRDPHIGSHIDDFQYPISLPILSNLIEVSWKPSETHGLMKFPIGQPDLSPESGVLIWRP